MTERVGANDDYVLLCKQNFKNVSSDKMTKSGVNFNPEIPPNPTSDHRPAPLRSFRHYCLILLNIKSTNLTVLPTDRRCVWASSQQDYTVFH